MVYNCIQNHASCGGCSVRTSWCSLIHQRYAARLCRSFSSKPRSDSTPQLSRVPNLTERNNKLRSAGSMAVLITDHVPFRQTYILTFSCILWMQRGETQMGSITRDKEITKLIQVDDNGKINRLRRECPAEECGAGVFMAAHFDRYRF